MGWNAGQIPDQTGRIAIVTGANVGLGLAAATGLARGGAEVVLACRDMVKATGAIDRIASDVPGAAVDALELNLASLSSIRNFVAVAQARFPDGVDLVINNAGVMMPPRRETEDGFELQFGTNHLGHFALTGLMLPSMRPRKGSRVVTLSSGMARLGKIDFDDLHGVLDYSRTGAYAQSKLANLSFALELQRRLEAVDSPIASMAAHPGYSATNLQKAGPQLGGGLTSTLAAPIMALGHAIFAQSAEAGAGPTLRAATDPDLPGGSYVGPDGPGEMRGDPVVVEPRRLARNPEVAGRLWSESERLTGVRFPTA